MSNSGMIYSTLSGVEKSGQTLTPYVTRILDLKASGFSYLAYPAKRQIN
jgi:hypothetical protein